MRRLCRARRGLCLDIVAGNTLFNFSLLGHLDNVRYYKVSSILSMLMTSSSNWLPSACDTIHLIMLLVHVACEVCVCALSLTKLNVYVENRYMQKTPLDHPSLFIAKIKWHRHYCYSYRNFTRIKRFAQKRSFAHGWQRGSLESV